jgi:alginate O-acetyltransferase complex protein AlgI
MLFSSPIFFVFFAVYFSFHLLIPHKYRVYLIICGSTIFYAWWKVEYVWLPYVLMTVAYAGARWIEQTSEAAARRRRTIVAIVALFLPLATFKYADFFYADVLGFQQKLLDLPLPLGVSFVTFTLTAYIVDIYRGRFSLDHGPASVLAYVLFFPHLIAGPILRPAELIPQMARSDGTRVIWPTAAIAIFTVGLMKKLVLANPLADFVDAIYVKENPSGPEALLALYGFYMQIYCDFSGYTDMAIGLAMLLGIRLPINFRQPYAALSLIDFWRRWHITLSFWLRDYLYIPLGGSRRGRVREIENVLVTMTLGGLWHGASWTFVIWGVLHGLGISFLHVIKSIPGLQALSRLPSWLSVLVTFHFVAVAWVFFRAPSLGKAAALLSAPLVGGGWSTLTGLLTANVFPLALMIVFFLSHRFDDHRRIKLAVRRVRGELLWPVIALGWLLALTVSQGSSAKFIYFDF